MGHLSWFTRPETHVLDHLSWVTCRGSHVLGHLSWVTRPVCVMSHLTPIPFKGHVIYPFTVLFQYIEPHFDIPLPGRDLLCFANHVRRA